MSEQAQRAFAGGMSKEDIGLHLANDGMDEATVTSTLSNLGREDATRQASRALEGGMAYEDVQRHLAADGYNADEVLKTVDRQPKDPGRITDAMGGLQDNPELSSKELLRNLQIVHPSLSAVHTDIAGFLGFDESLQESEEAAKVSRQRIANEAAERGYQLEWNGEDWIADGEVITPAWYESIVDNAGEIALGVAGTAAGLALAPAGLAGLAVAGLGGVIGTMAGSNLDYFKSAMIAQEDMDANIAMQRTLNAAEIGVLGEFGGLVIGKLGWQGIKRAKKFIDEGFTDKSAQALEETMFIGKEEATELANKLAAVATKGEANTLEAVALTKQGAEQMVSSAVSSSPTAANAMGKSINARAQDVIKTTKDLAGENLGKFMRTELESYQALVKQQYADVKQVAAEAPRLKNFTFNYDEVAIDPMLEGLGKELVSGSTEQMAFLHKAQKVRDLSSGRRLPDLIELNKLINSFQNNKKLANSKSFEMLANVKSHISSGIEQGAKETMDDPEKWLGDWAKANKDYAEMKNLETNRLARAIAEKPTKLLSGKSEEDLSKALTKYATSLDSTFNDVIKKLPAKSQARVEGGVINNMAEAATLGKLDGMRATDFPQLADELNKVTFTTPQARRTAQAINELADVFKNDTKLVGAVSGSFPSSGGGSAMTDNPLMKAKYELATSTWQKFKAMLPTEYGRQQTLLKNTAKILSNPLDSKTLKELGADAPDMTNIWKHMGNQQDTRMKFYGNGKVLQPKGAGQEHSIQPSRIASIDDVAQLAKDRGINPADKDAITAALRESGYLAEQTGTETIKLLEK